MEQPRIDFAGYNFDGDKGCIVCSHVMNGHPVLLVCHEDDGDLQFVCGAPAHEGDDYAWVHASHVLSQHSDSYDLPTVRFGFLAERDSVNDDWKVSPISD
jgi:hypothetical protein